MAESYNVRTVVLKTTVSKEAAKEIIESKKTGVFKTLLARPKKDEVHVHSIKLNYECILLVSGKYVADYYRKAVHAVSVDSEVREVVLGDGVFPVRTKSGLEKALTGGRGKNKVDLPLEEHVFVEDEDQAAFDHHGRQIDMPYKVDSEAVENYPKRLLSTHEQNVRRLEITHDAALSKLRENLQRPLEPDVRDLTEEFVLQDAAEVFVPIFEARLVGPKKKVGILRLDAVRKKVL